MSLAPHAWRDGLRLAVGTLSVLPVPAPSRVGPPEARVAMTLTPAVGIALGLAAGVPLILVERTAPGTVLAAAVGVAAVAGLSRGLHLDGLADVGDGLGSRRSGDEALRVMKEPSIGALGAVLLVLVLLLQVAALASAIGAGAGAGALLVAVVTGRAAITIGCTAGVEAARPDGLGAAVAGVVPRAVTGVVCTATVLLGLLVGLLDPDTAAWSLALAPVIGLLVGVATLQLCVRRFGGMTGDVLGACCELAVTGALVTAAITV